MKKDDFQKRAGATSTGAVQVKITDAELGAKLGGQKSLEQAIAAVQSGKAPSASKSGLKAHYSTQGDELYMHCRDPKYPAVSKRAATVTFPKGAMFAPEQIAILIKSVDSKATTPKRRDNPKPQA